MDSTGFVLVIGAAGLDYKGYPASKFEMGNDVPGEVRYSFGGVARNIAENLARLELEVVMLTALGRDAAGEIVLQHCQHSGIQMQHVLRSEQYTTGTYIAILSDGGLLAAAISDNRIMAEISPAYLDQHETLFAGARLLVLDLNIPAETLDRAFQLAARHELPIVVDPTSPARASALKPYLDRIYIVTPNSAETTSLCGLEIPAQDLEGAVTAAHHLVSLGTEIAIVTLGERGLAYSDGKRTGHIPAVKSQVTDETGAGDALFAGVIFGLLNDVPLDDAMRLGVTAASITLQSRESVSPDLTPDLLYSSLVV